MESHGCGFVDKGTRSFVHEKMQGIIVKKMAVMKYEGKNKNY